MLSFVRRTAGKNDSYLKKLKHKNCHITKPNSNTTMRQYAGRDLSGYLVGCKEAATPNPLCDQQTITVTAVFTEDKDFSANTQ